MQTNSNQRKHGQNEKPVDVTVYLFIVNHISQTIHRGRQTNSLHPMTSMSKNSAVSVK